MGEHLHEADELFQERPDQFTTARNALAKRLKADGDREEAARVAALRRPTLTAWTLNRLARIQPDLVQAVIGAGERLRDATERAMGGDRSGFQQAQADERSAIQRAAEAAATVLVEGGGKDNDSSRQRITETLRAASVDAEVADRLNRGVLESDASAPGFGLDGFVPVRTAKATRSVAVEDTPATRRRERDLRVEELESALAEATARWNAATAEADEAATRASDLRKQAVEARREVGLAQKLLDQERKRRH